MLSYHVLSDLTLVTSEQCIHYKYSAVVHVETGLMIQARLPPFKDTTDWPEEAIYYFHKLA